MRVSNANLIREPIKVAVPQVVPVFSTRPAAEASCITDLLFTVTQIIDVDDRDLIEGQNGSFPNASQDHSIQLCVVFHNRAVHFQTQQVGGKIYLLDAGGELASLRVQSFVGLAGPQNLPPANKLHCNTQNTINVIQLWRICNIVIQLRFFTIYCNTSWNQKFGHSLEQFMITIKNIAASSNYGAKHYRSKHQTNCSNE